MGFYREGQGFERVTYAVFIPLSSLPPLSADESKGVSAMLTAAMAVDDDPSLFSLHRANESLEKMKEDALILEIVNDTSATDST